MALRFRLRWRRVDEASKYAALHETEQYGILQSIFACGAILLGANRMIDALRCFLAVVDTGNLSKAAKTLSLAVSSVSRKIDWLESELHGKLFHRSSRLVRLTDAGERFLPSARHIVAELAEAKAAVASVEIEPRGLITVTAPASLRQAPCRTCRGRVLAPLSPVGTRSARERRDCRFGFGADRCSHSHWRSAE